jgi:hypothetical protein
VAACSDGGGDGVAAAVTVIARSVNKQSRGQVKSSQKQTSNESSLKLTASRDRETGIGKKVESAKR